MTTRRDFIAQTLAASAALVVPRGGAIAQAWPSRPIRLVVPLPPGGGSDYLARVMTERLQSALGQPILVENRVGADGRIGTEYVSKQPPDGHTFLVITTNELSAPSMFRKMNYDILNDFAPVSLLAAHPFVLLVHPSVAVNSVNEFIAFARAKPGVLTFASSGVGSFYHLVAELLKSMTGIDMLHVPYRGSGPVTQALLSGEVMSAFAPLGPFLAHIRSGKLRPLAVVDSSRASLLPEVPTIAEAVPLPGFALISWHGVLAPAGTPRTIVDRLSAELVRIIHDPQFSKERLLERGLEPIGSTPEQLGDKMKADFDMFAKIIRDARIPAE